MLTHIIPIWYLPSTHTNADDDDEGKDNNTLSIQDVDDEHTLYFPLLAIVDCCRLSTHAL